MRAVVKSAAGMALDAAGISDPCEIAVLACDDARIAALNEDFRGKFQPTNVLSWPAHDLAPLIPGETPSHPPAPFDQDSIALGDVAIALQTCESEAKSAGIPLKNHVMHLILHGCLHLLGYDHETEADAVLMEGLESRAMIEAGFPDPYG
ncbi:MAG: rRNA maturation RNase YbeY [Pseudomonadota bacterium]